MAALADLLTYVHDEVPSAPRSLAERALQDAARNFFYYSTVWRVTLPDIRVRSGRATYEIPAEDGTDVVGVHRARLDGRRLGIVGADEADDWDEAHVMASRPLRLEVVNQTEVRLLPAPQDAGVLTLRVSLQPLRGATEIPDFAASRYGADIALGAKEALCRMREVSWSSPADAESFMGRFRAATGKARRDIESSFNSAEQTTRLRKWV